MSVDKKYCMSSYLAFRYIEDDDKDFYEGMHHENIKEIPREQRIPVYNAKDIDIANLRILKEKNWEFYFQVVWILQYVHHICLAVMLIHFDF